MSITASIVKRRLVVLGLCAVTALTYVWPSAAQAREFLVRPGGESKVVFVSRAAMEKFEGKTSRLEGRIVVNPDSVGDSVGVHFEVDMASLDTGIAMRNKHMRENHLDTQKFPKATFDGASVLSPAGGKLDPGKTVALDIEGTFTLHGVSRRIRIGVEATYTRKGGAGDRIAFRTEFPVTLADYEISRPQFLFLKLAESQTVRVSGVGVAGP